MATFTMLHLVKQNAGATADMIPERRAAQGNISLQRRTNSKQDILAADP